MINEALGTRRLNEEPTGTEEEPSQEPPSASAPPGSGAPQIGINGITGTAATPEPTPTDEVLDDGLRNPTNSHVAFPQS